MPLIPEALTKKRCCSLDSINDARQLAVDCGFPHIILDIRDEFGDYIIDNFVDEYIAGRTPNPCVFAIHTLSGKPY